MPHYMNVFLYLIPICARLSFSTWVFVILYFTEAIIVTFLVSLLVLYNIRLHFVAIHFVCVIFCVIPYFKANIFFCIVNFNSRYSFSFQDVVLLV